MDSAKGTRYIGIIGDGRTDREILSKLIKSLLDKERGCEPVMLTQSLTVAMDAFRAKAPRSRTHALSNKPSQELKRSIITVLHAALSEFQSKIPRALEHLDFIVLNTDVERELKRKNGYFEAWAIVISKIFLMAIEEFYHIKEFHGFQWETLPLISPLVLFPSTDILIAAAKSHINDTSFICYGLKAREIKRMLYGVTDLRQLSDQDFNEKALAFINTAACDAIYKHLPESRLFLRTLWWN